MRLFRQYTNPLMPAEHAEATEATEQCSWVIPEDTDLETIKAAKAGSVSISEAIADTVAKVGENMTLRRAAGVSVGKGVVASYVHNSVADGLGKIGVLVGLESQGKAEELAELGRKIAMHVAAASPLAVDSAGLDPAVVAREQSVLADVVEVEPDQIFLGLSGVVVGHSSSSLDVPGQIPSGHCRSSRRSVRTGLANGARQASHNT